LGGDQNAHKLERSLAKRGWELGRTTVRPHTGSNDGAAAATSGDSTGSAGYNAGRFVSRKGVASWLGMYSRLDDKEEMDEEIDLSLRL